jgi:uncharacterized protein (TIGR02466 family)
MIAYDLACAPIYIKRLVNSEELLQKFEKTADELVNSNKDSWGYDWAEGCGSWNSHSLYKNLVFETELFPELRELFIECVGEYLDELSATRKYNYEITESWLNATSKYIFQEYHQHRPHLVSGSFYISSPRELGRFYIKNPCYYPENEVITEYMQDKKFLDLDAGYIVIFPSNLEHGVEQNPKEKNRYSVTFNVDAV